jgi:hypothetical protein
MRMAHRTVRIILQLDADDVEGAFDEDEFDSHLETYLRLIQREPISTILLHLETEQFLKKGKGKNAYLSIPMKRKMRQKDITFRNLESQTVRDELVGYRYEKGALIPTPKTGESSKRPVSDAEREKVYSKRTSDFMDAFDKNYAVIIEDKLKEYLKIANTSQEKKDGTISTKAITVQLDTKEYFRKLFIKNGFGDFNDPDEFYFGLRGTDTDEPTSRDEKTDEYLDIAAEVTGAEKQMQEKEAHNYLLGREDFTEKGEDDIRREISQETNIKEDDVTFAQMAYHLDPNWRAEYMEAKDGGEDDKGFWGEEARQERIDEATKMLKAFIRKAAPTKTDTALATMGHNITGKDTRNFFIRDFDGKKKIYNTIEEFHEALVDFKDNEFTVSEIEDMLKKELDSKKQSRLKTQLKAYLTPKNNLLEVGNAEIEIHMDVTKLESPESLLRYIMSDKQWGEKPFDEGPDDKSTPYEKEKNSLKKRAQLVFKEIRNVMEVINADGDKPYLHDFMTMLFGSQVGLFEKVINSDSLENVTKYPEERNSRIKVKDVLERIDTLKVKLAEDLEDAQKGSYAQEEANVTDPSGNEIWFKYDPETKQYGKSVGVMAMHPKGAAYVYGRHDSASREEMAKNPTRNWVLTKPVELKDNKELKEAYEATKHMSRYLDLEGSEEGEAGVPNNPEEVKAYLSQLKNVVGGITNALDRLSASMRKTTKKTDNEGNPLRGEPAGKNSLNWYLAYVESDGDANDIDEFLEDWFTTTPTSKGGWREIGSQPKDLDIPLVWIGKTKLKKTATIDTRAQRPESWRRSASGKKNPYRAGTHFGDERIGTRKKKKIEVSVKDGKKRRKEEKEVLDQYGGGGKPDDIKAAILDLHSIYVEYIELKEIVESAT